MTKVVKKIAHIANKTSPIKKLADKAGLGRNNSLRRLLDPAQESFRTIDEEGMDAFKGKLKAGDITDPGGIFHKVNPDVTADAAPSGPDLATATANVDTSRNRRRRRGVLANLYGMAGSSNTGRATLG